MLVLPKLQLEDVFACAQCGYCMKRCPVYYFLGWESTSPRGKIFALKEILGNDGRLDEQSIRKLGKSFSTRFFNCTFCGFCREVCHVEIDLLEIWSKVREILYDHEVVPESIIKLSETVKKSKNIYMMDNLSRTDWITYTGADVNFKDSAEVVYFVGCITSFSGRVQSIAQAVSSILNSANEDWTLLKDEWCCGHPLALSGAIREARVLALHNVEMIESTGAKKVVTGCPGCYLALKHEYPRLLGKKPRFEVLHSSQLLDTYITSGKLVVPKADITLTYHDPCELGRISGVIREPRVVLQSVTDTFIEPEYFGRESICCGSGGLLKAVNPSLADNLTQRRYGMLASTNAEVIVSACPACVQALAQTATAIQNGKRVIDISQLIAEQLGLM
ncbi:MAG: (Fe-S)-binding protein [Nitrososphaerota archaeon]